MGSALEAALLIVTWLNNEEKENSRRSTDSTDLVAIVKNCFGKLKQLAGSQEIECVIG